LQWYTLNADDKLRRKYAIEYFAKQGKKKEVLAINKAEDYDVRQLGTLCRLLANGNTLSDDHMNALDNMVKVIMAKEELPAKIKEDKTVIVPVTSRIVVGLEFPIPINPPDVILIISEAFA